MKFELGMKDMSVLPVERNMRQNVPTLFSSKKSVHPTLELDKCS